MQWMDVAKGVCILLVVLWHVIMKHYLRIDWHIGVPIPGAWGAFGEMLLPLRMPLFFTVSGMLSVSVMRRPWRTVGRTRIAKFIYLYVLWLLIHTAVFAGFPGLPTDRAESVSDLLVQLTLTPSNLWYLFALALYVAVAKLVRSVPPAVVLTAAAALSAVTAAGLLSTPGNRAGLLQNLVFFLAGLYLRPYVLRWAAYATPRRLLTVAAAHVLLYAAVTVVGGERWFGVWLVLSVVALAVGVAGAVHIRRFPRVQRALAALGHRTLVIYVLHMPILAVADRLLLGPLTDLGRAGQLVVAVAYPVLLTAAVVGICLGLHRALLAARATWLFDLPARRVAQQASTSAVAPRQPSEGTAP